MVFFIKNIYILTYFFMFLDDHKITIDINFEFSITANYIFEVKLMKNEELEKDFSYDR